jgi:hypothetical protein
MHPLHFEFQRSSRRRGRHEQVMAGSDISAAHALSLLGGLRTYDVALSLLRQRRRLRGRSTQLSNDRPRTLAGRVEYLLCRLSRAVLPAPAEWFRSAPTAAIWQWWRPAGTGAQTITRWRTHLPEPRSISMVKTNSRHSPPSAGSNSAPLLGSNPHSATTSGIGVDRYSQTNRRLLISPLLFGYRAAEPSPPPGFLLTPKTLVHTSDRPPTTIQPRKKKAKFLNPARRPTTC